MGADMTTYILTKRDLAEKDIELIYSLRLQADITEDPKEPTSHFYNDSDYTLINTLKTVNGVNIFKFSLWKMYMFELVEENIELFKDCVIMDFSDEGDGYFIVTKVDGEGNLTTLRSLKRHRLTGDAIRLEEFCNGTGFVNKSDIEALSSKLECEY